MYKYLSALLEHPFLGDVSVANLVASMSGVVLGGVVEVVGSNLAKGKLFKASNGSVDLLYILLIYIFTYINMIESKLYTQYTDSKIVHKEIYST